MRPVPGALPETSRMGNLCRRRWQHLFSGRLLSFDLGPGFLDLHLGHHLTWARPEQAKTAGVSWGGGRKTNTGTRAYPRNTHGTSQKKHHTDTSAIHVQPNLIYKDAYGHRASCFDLEKVKEPNTLCLCPTPLFAGVQTRAGPACLQNTIVQSMAFR